MQPRGQLYIESESLFKKVREHFAGASEFKEGAAGIYLDGLDIQFVPGGEGAGRLGGVFMDEDYVVLVGQKDRYDQLIWFNPLDDVAPSAMPIHDFDIVQLDLLGDFASIAPRPSLEQCLAWWDMWEVPENIRQHVTKVAEASYKVAVWMRQAGIDVDPILIHRAGLAHDLDKIATLQEPNRHGQVTANFLLEQGFPELAEIVRDHLLGLFLHEELGDISWETKLVNFCDKLVEADQVVPIPVRFSALKKRYPHSRVLLDSTEPYLWELNDEICEILGIEDHGALISRLNA